jgi:general secretion pathway protein C
MTNRYFTIINLLLVTVGIYLCVNGFYLLFSARLGSVAVSTASSQPAEPTVKPPPPPPFDAYRAILARNIFNSSREAPAPTATAVDLEKLKQTDLKLKLWGTVTGQARDAYAVIEDIKSRQQDLYRAGDTVQDAVVKLILRGKVVLTVNGHDEILTMEELSSRASRRPTRRISQTPGMVMGKKLPVSRYRRKIRLKSEQIQRAMENLGQLMQQATLRPHIEGGQPAGISITGIKPNALFRKMRLRNGDIITGVNGESIQSVEDALRVFDQLSSGSNIQLQIKRRGRQQTLDYSIE